MSDFNSCPKCGGPLPDNGALGGGCPRCMLELGFETTIGSRGRTDSGIAAARPAVIGRYRILRLIGEGGMGAVYEAEQDHPRRTVALKIIKSGMASAELLRRFEQESQALGRLQHPGIAQIYEAGTVDTGFGPHPYFAMELIRGRSPRDYAEAKHWNVRERLQMMVKICDAVHHAHQRGLIHRDLKPGNILVDETGQPKILDFGVARVTDSDARATLQTNMGQLIGTLAYMSPEQALADPLDIDTRSDVYSLGVILYELLSGRLPYTISKKVHEAIHAIREEDPARLSTSNRMFRGDIETIVAKALEKERSRRYASAAEMAADIQRYLNDEPIVARRPSASYQLQKFARRNKALVTGIAAVFVVLVVGITASTWYATIARQALSDLQVSQYFNDISLADREWLASNIGHADQLLNETTTRLRNWEWNYLVRRNHMEDAAIVGHRAPIGAIAFVPALKRLRTVSTDRIFKDWDIENHQEAKSGAFGETVTGNIGVMELSANGRTLYSRLSSMNNGVLVLIHKVWDLSNGKEVFSFDGLSASVRANESRHFGGFSWGPEIVSPDGRRVVAVFDSAKSGASRFVLRSWDIGSGNEVASLGAYADRIVELAFSPDGTKLALVRSASTVVLNSSTGHELVTLDNSSSSTNALVFSTSGLDDSESSITSLAFSSDGRTIVAGIRNLGVRAWNTMDGRERWFVSIGTVSQIAFSPDSNLVAAAVADRTIRILESVTGREVARLSGNMGAIRSLTFTFDSTQIVSGGDDRLIRIWNLRPAIPERILNAGQILSRVRVSPDGSSVLVSTGDGLKALNVNTGHLAFELPYSSGRRDVDYSEDGARIVVLSGANANDVGRIRELADLQVLDAHSGREISVLDPPEKERAESSITQEFRISPSGNRAALVSQTLSPEQEVTESKVQIWETASRKLTANIHFARTLVRSFQLSPNGKLAATFALTLTGDGSDIGTRVEIYDTTTSHLLHKLKMPELAVNASLVFSPDADRLAEVADGRVITIWDVHTGKKLVAFPESGNSIMGIAFSPDGTRLVSVSSEGEVWLWDAELGKALIPLRASSGPYAVSEVSVIAEKYAPQPLAPIDALVGRSASGPMEPSISFSANGRKITLTTVVPNPTGAIVRIETWDGSPRQK